MKRNGSACFYPLCCCLQDAAAKRAERMIQAVREVLRQVPMLQKVPQPAV